MRRHTKNLQEHFNIIDEELLSFIDNNDILAYIYDEFYEGIEDILFLKYKNISSSEILFSTDINSLECKDDLKEKLITCGKDMQEDIKWWNTNLYKIYNWSFLDMYGCQNFLLEITGDKIEEIKNLKQNPRFKELKKRDKEIYKKIMEIEDFPAWIDKVFQEAQEDIEKRKKEGDLLYKWLK